MQLIAERRVLRMSAREADETIPFSVLLFFGEKK